MKPALATIYFILLTGFALLPAHAQSVKKWVDEDGVTHYSDEAPKSPGIEVDEIETRDNPAATDSDEVNQRILRQAEQLERDRKERERLAREAEKRRRVEAALERDGMVVEPEKENKDGWRRRRPFYPGPHIQPIRKKRH